MSIYKDYYENAMTEVRRLRSIVREYEIGMTDERLKVLDNFIDEYKKENGAIPTIEKLKSLGATEDIVYYYRFDENFIKSVYEEKPLLEFKTIQDIIIYLENNDISINEIECGWELEWYSDAGEDVIETINHDNTIQGIIGGFKELSNNFDAKEHASIWFESADKNGTPDIFTLVEDAKSIEKFINEIADELLNAHIIENNITLDNEPDITDEL